MCCIPIGYDAFGLPTENYAIKNHIHPAKVTQDNIARLHASSWRSLGYSFDWDREINTTDPDYYKWTQWIFLQLFKKGLAYKTGDARQLVHLLQMRAGQRGGRGRRVRTLRRRSGPQGQESQWMLKHHRIRPAPHRRSGRWWTYIERVKTQQRNWIGRSTGAEVNFNTTSGDDSDRLYHPSGYPVRRHLYGYFARASRAWRSGRTSFTIWTRCSAIPRASRRQVRL